MDGKIKEIMRNSFHNFFYIDRNDIESNYKYLDSLVDYVLNIEDLDDNDYEYIAKKVWEVDSRIKTMYIPNMEILPECLKKLDFDDLLTEYWIVEPTKDDIKRIFRSSYTNEDLKNSINLCMIINNWDYIEKSIQKQLLENICSYLFKIYGVELQRGCMYKAVQFDSNVYSSIALNELIYWISDKIDCKFSHQTFDSIKMLEVYEKNEVYYHTYKLLVEREFNNISKHDNNSIVEKILKPKVPNYNKDENDFIFSGVSENEKKYIDALIYLKNRFDECLFDSIKGIISITKESTILKKENQIKQNEIQRLNKEIAYLHHQIEVANNTIEKNNIVFINQDSVLKKELASLRDYIFYEQTNIGNEEIDDNSIVYNGQYNSVAIVGGHNKWRNKVIKCLEGVTVINTDQNVVDWSFMDSVNIVVIVTNYISHSMYKRVMRKIKGHELIYLRYKNIEKLKNELDNRLIKLI